MGDSHIPRQCCGLWHQQQYQGLGLRHPACVEVCCQQMRQFRLTVRIPEDPATYSDNIRPPVPGYPATCDALP